MTEIIESKNILFFDTETSGLPNFKAHNSDPSQPYVLQLAGILCSPEGETLKEYCTLIKPANENPIHPKAFEAHGITREHCTEHGVTQEEAFYKFIELVNKSSLIVAHNYNFDIRLLGIMSAQLAEDTDGDSRELYKSFKAMPSICTMMSTTKYCAIPQKGRGGLKWPKLEELYEIMFREKMYDKYNAHDALEDVRCTRDCYFELKARGVL